MWAHQIIRIQVLTFCYIIITFIGPDWQLAVLWLLRLQVQVWKVSQPDELQSEMLYVESHYLFFLRNQVYRKVCLEAKQVTLDMQGFACVEWFRQCQRGPWKDWWSWSAPTTCPPSPPCCLPIGKLIVKPRQNLRPSRLHSLSLALLLQNSIRCFSFAFSPVTCWCLVIGVLLQTLLGSPILPVYILAMQYFESPRPEK